MEEASKVLTPLQHRFAMNYAKHGNGSKAAKEAGAKGKDNKSFASIANRLLNEPGVREVIADMQKELVISAGIDGNEIITQLRMTAMEARQDGKFDAAFKCYAKLGDYIGLENPENQKSNGSALIDIFTQHSEGEESIDNEIREQIFIK